MSDVKAVINLVAKFELLKVEIEKVIVGHVEEQNNWFADCEINRSTLYRLT
jgi:hypothetical protein